MKRQHVIGMFDSGVGGLTVMKEILEQIPELRIIYLGDTARVPYGNRSKEELIDFGEEIITFLISQGAEAVVVACNTSSANALPDLKKSFDIPLIGTIEPGARLAVSKTSGGKIGLIATEATVRSKAYSSAISRVLSKGVLPEDQGLRESWQQGEQSIALVKSQACPLFVPLVEAGLSKTPEARGIARTYLSGFDTAGVDALILGCTHYPFLAPVIRDILGEQTALIDPAQAMVDELKSVLDKLDEVQEMKAKSTVKETWKLRFYVSGDPELFQSVGNTLLPGLIQEVRQVIWGD
ncbi:glutamate racemase [Desulfitobacterium metallireducens]|uniref:Glutamate racemase n=1 Tax=Desulfitobacterium metallireducens DSM 15288 TaxID=871968 RepID=W0EFY3_9FIRM|nr:glutamate racemase [Desulfitobacterium metallireducens]AHF07986.1 glutamate racemase [Desulfitobacterium metallireducens DSM 15288]